ELLDHYNSRRGVVAAPRWGTTTASDPRLAPTTVRPADATNLPGWSTSRQGQRDSLDGHPRQSAFTDRLVTVVHDCRSYRDYATASFRQKRRRTAAHALIALASPLAAGFRQSTASLGA